MKNFKFLSLILATILIFASCTNNDDDADFEEGLEGQWLLTNVASTNAHDFNNDGRATTNILLETNCYLNEVYDFYDDSTGAFTSSSHPEIVAMLVPGTTDNYAYATGCIGEKNVTTFSWAVEDNVIAITSSEDSEVLMLPVNQDKFSFVSALALTVKRSNDNTIIIEEDLIFTYTKQ